MLQAKYHKYLGDTYRKGIGSKWAIILLMEIGLISVHFEIDIIWRLEELIGRQYYEKQT